MQKLFYINTLIKISIYKIYILIIIIKKIKTYIYIYHKLYGIRLKLQDSNAWTRYFKKTKINKTSTNNIQIKNKSKSRKIKSYFKICS
jgi:hypothetical protein